MRIRLNLLLLVLVVTLSSVVASAQRGRDLSTDARTLVNTQWRLVSLGRVGAEANVSGPTPITLNFGADGRASGSGGCNSYSSTFRVQGDSLSFGPTISTKRACLDSGANQREQQFFNALSSANRFRLSRGRLSISYDGGRSVMSFADESQPEETPDEPSENDPVAALARYYRLINSKDYERAHRFWESPNESLDQFVRGFSDTVEVRFFFEPPARLDGAAGSIYAEIPTVLIARRSRGNDRTYVGCYVMRRSNVSDRGWRISRANLTQTARLIAPPTCQN
jgi:heat shock protein HslJ